MNDIDPNDLAYDCNGRLLGVVVSWRLSMNGLVPVIIPIECYEIYQSAGLPE